MKSVSIMSAALLLFAVAAPAQPTAFTYQGRLSDGTNPATGVYDFRFQIYNGGGVVAGPLTNAPVGVTNGLFTVALDFGASVFNGSALTLEIGVRTNGSAGAYSVLAPRQPVLSVPYAIQSLNAANAATLTAPLQATNITGTISDARLSTNVALLNGNQTFIGANLFGGAVTTTNPANVFAGAFSGNGFGLTNLSTTNLIGTLPDARQSTNVALLNSNLVFGGANKFTGALTATNPANVFAGTFSGNGFGLTSLSTTNLIGTLPDARLSTNIAMFNSNANFSGSVSAGLFNGNGHGLTNVPGAFFWVTVSGTSTTAGSNVGFIATNDVTPVTITLPPSPSVGDTFKVAGIGGAGWIIAQNAGQNIFSGNLSGSVGQSWKAVEGSANWSAIASSADGTKLAAAINGGNIYTSANSGASWTARASGLNWSSIASSADGTKLVATVGYTIYNTAATGQIYTSPDSGTTWTPRDSTRTWASVASSSDGTKLVAAVHAGQIYTSTDSGASWTPRDSTRNWTAVASSDNGAKLVAAVEFIGIYTSTDSGANWLQRTNLTPAWTAVASSADGSRLVATAVSGAIYISTDSGATWVLQNSNISGQLTSVVSSSDGARLAATTGGNSATAMGHIFSSSDSGSAWIQLNGAPASSWSGIAASADGSVLAATVYGGDIYVSSQSSTTAGATGYLAGGQHSAIELIYAGNGIFLPLNHEGTIRAY